MCIKKHLVSLIAILIILLSASTTWAEFEFEKLTDVSDHYSMFQVYNEGTFAHVYTTQINGKEYIIDQGDMGFSQVMEYNAEEYMRLCKASNFGGTMDYLWTGEYYFLRNCSMDGAPSPRTFNQMPFGGRLLLIDGDYNVVKDITFKKYVYRLGYYNGKYYYQAYDGMVYVSEDFDNWEETGEEIPQANSKVAAVNSSVALEPDRFTLVKHEDPEKTGLHVYRSGDWFVKVGGNALYLSNDNIYFVKIHSPVSFLSGYGNSKIRFTYGFEYGDSFVVFKSHLATPKQPLYDELERLKSAPYIKLNDNILGFEQAPVREDDRLLVPMRFLFEQMGAVVVWNDSTQTATVKGAGSEVSFSIDNKVATVNNSSKIMDVPARLINGKTMVPLRFLSEELGCNVNWDENLNMAIITSN